MRFISPSFLHSLPMNCSSFKSPGPMIFRLLESQRLLPHRRKCANSFKLLNSKSEGLKRMIVSREYFNFFAKTVLHRGVYIQCQRARSRCWQLSFEKFRELMKIAWSLNSNTSMQTKLILAHSVCRSCRIISIKISCSLYLRSFHRFILRLHFVCTY